MINECAVHAELCHVIHQAPAVTDVLDADGQAMNECLRRGWVVATGEPLRYTATPEGLREYERLCQVGTQVLYDSPEAACQIIHQVWVSRWGHPSLTEDGARYDGSTHQKCQGCDTIIERSRIRCEPCYEKQREDEYRRMARGPYKEGPVFSDLLDRFFTPRELRRLVKRGTRLEDLRLVLCEPEVIYPVDADDLFQDTLGEADTPPWLSDAVEALNAVIQEHADEPVSWRASDVALDLDTLP